MKILVVCQYYYPENFQINDICEGLVERGNEVTVLTGLPNYPSGIVLKEYRHGKKRAEIINGVNVVRCFEIGRKKGVLGLSLNYISYCLAARRKICKLKDKFDIIFVYQLSPVLMGIPACHYKDKYKVPILLYCCDLWPESMKLIIKNEKSLLFRIILKLSSKVYQSCEKVVVQTKYFYPYFQEVHGLSDSQLAYIPQFANECHLKQEYHLDNGIIDFVFLGNIGIAQDLNRLVDAVDYIRDVQGFQVHIVGDGSCLPDLKKLVKKQGLQSIIKFYGRRSVEEMPTYYKLADVCLVSLSNDNLTGMTLPSKVQGYMAAGKMIIGMSDGATKKVITDSNCGLCVASGDSKNLAKVMRAVIDNPEKYKNCGLNGREYFKKHFTKEKFISSLEKVIKEIVGN